MDYAHDRSMGMHQAHGITTSAVLFWLFFLLFFGA